ncbi:MAG: hypothetical protein IJT54_05130 [Candidatus Methanomethylophilaceae archaeon]|nr:hypothetical protein [Candidatus Methanomethylophilaceae archaeon]
MSTLEDSTLLDLLRRGIDNVPDMILELYPGVKDWEKGSKRSHLYTRLNKLEKFDMVRKTEIIDHIRHWELVQ